MQEVSTGTRRSRFKESSSAPLIRPVRMSGIRDLKRPRTRIHLNQTLLTGEVSSKTTPLPLFGSPADAWQTGTLKDSSESWHSRSAGSIYGTSNPTYGNVHGSMASREYPIVQYTIDTPGYVYQANLVLRHAKDKQPPLTVNGPIKFAIVKSDFYIQDEQGKEHKLVLVKKTLKTADQE